MAESATTTTLIVATSVRSASYADATAPGAIPARNGPAIRGRGTVSTKMRSADLPTPERGAELRSQWVKAKRAGTAIAEALERDPPTSYGPACDLSAALDAMWKLRKQRGDENWVSILDCLQLALRELGGDGVSFLSPQQGRKLEVFVHTLLSLSEKSDRDLLEAVRLVDELGVPPFVDFKTFAEAAD